MEVIIKKKLQKDTLTWLDLDAIDIIGIPQLKAAEE
jgi:hypothetical protein